MAKALKKQAECLEKENILLVEMEGNSVAALDRAGAAPGELGAALLAGSRVGGGDDATVVLIRLDAGHTL